MEVRDSAARSSCLRWRSGPSCMQPPWVRFPAPAPVPPTRVEFGADPHCPSPCRVRLPLYPAYGRHSGHQGVTAFLSLACSQLPGTWFRPVTLFGNTVWYSLRPTLSCLPCLTPHAHPCLQRWAMAAAHQAMQLAAHFASHLVVQRILQRNATQFATQRRMQRILQCNTACSASCNATEASPPCTCSALCPSAWRFPIFGCLVLWVWMRRPCHSVSSTGDMLPVLTPPTGGGGTRVCHAGRPETRLPAPAPRYWGLRPSATGAITGVRFLPPHRHLPPGGSREQSPQTSLVSAQRSPLFSAPVAGTVPGLRGASVSGPAHSQWPSPSYAVWRGRSPCTHVRQPFVVPPRTLRDLSSQVLPYHPPCEGLGCALGYSALGTTVRFCLSVQGSWSVLSLQARP